MSSNPLLQLENFGQSVWLDFISRSLIDKGELRFMIERDHVSGVTSNPSIFEKAISSGTDYDGAIAAMKKEGHGNAKMVYEQLAIRDIKDACDLLRPVFEQKGKKDGFVSLEVSPHLALDADGTIEEGLKLFYQVDRPNLMIKVPGTNEGMRAIRTLINEGVNVNVTLLFSTQRYADAAKAYLMGLSDRMKKGLSVDSVHSVASFFVSRIDSKIDPMLKNIAENSDNKEQVKVALSLLGTIAIANAKIAYLKKQQIYQQDLAKDLLERGAKVQRLLWASTSTKNENYSDVLYIDSLIGKNTVNTMPLDTLKAFRDHGTAEPTLVAGIDQASEKLRSLNDLGIDFDNKCQELLSEGIKLFADSFDKLLHAIQKKL